MAAKGQRSGARAATKKNSAKSKNTRQASTKRDAEPSAAAADLAAKRAADKATRAQLMNDLKASTSDAAARVAASGAQANAAGLGADKVSLLGHAVWLLTQTATHKHLFISDLEWLVIPPVALNQFRLWRQGNMPVAFATWAFLSAEAEERMKQGIRRISPMDWKLGENLWLMDMIAPFGGQDEAMKELREKVFEGRTIKTLQPAPSGEGMAVVEW